MSKIIGYFASTDSKKLSFSHYDIGKGKQHIIVLEKMTSEGCSEFQKLTFQLVREKSDTLHGRLNIETVDETILEKISFIPRDGINIEEIDIDDITNKTYISNSAFEFSKYGEENDSEDDNDGYYSLSNDYFIRNKYKSSKK